MALAVCKLKRLSKIYVQMLLIQYCQEFLWFWRTLDSKGILVIVHFWWNLHLTDNLLLYFDDFLNLLYILFACILFFSSKYCKKLSGSTNSAHTVKCEIQKKTAFGSGTPLHFRYVQIQLDFSMLQLCNYGLCLSY